MAQTPGLTALRDEETRLLGQQARAAISADQKKRRAKVKAAK